MAGWKKLDEMQMVSRRLPRLDAGLKVTGDARYTSDIKLEGMLYGAVLGSPHAAARVKKVDDSRARQLPGVKAVLADLKLNGTVRYAGEFMAAVAAVSPQVAQEALALIEVEYEKGEFVVDLEEGMRDGAPKVFTERENVQEGRVNEDGNVERGFAEAEVVVEDEFRTQVQTHSPLETHGCVVKWEGDELTIWTSTQAVHGVRKGVADSLEMPLNKVRVICHHMGGGFGGKLWPGPYMRVAVNLAKGAGAPVKLMLSRKDEHLGVGNRPSSLQKLKLGAGKDGKLVAFAAETYGTAGISGGAGMPLPYIYSVPNRRHEHRDVLINAGGGRPFRAPGHPQACFATEQIMDEMAEALGMDPLELRLLNDPNETRQQEWKIGAERIGWKRRKPSGSDSGRMKRGMGLAASTWGGGGGGTQAQMKLFPDGSVEVKFGTQDLGTGTWTHVAAVAAEELGLPIEAIKPLIGDSDYPYSGGSGGSTTAASVAPAIVNTARMAKEKLAELAARHFGVDAEQLIFAGGHVSVEGDADKSLTWAETCSMMATAVLSVQGEWVEGLSSRGVAGCQFAEVEVDTDTGRIQVVKLVAVVDCGLVLNRLAAESQINGGVIQGISYALFEERLMDSRTGTMVNADLENYKIAGALETPEIEIVLFDQPERGVIGLGEPPTIPTSAAVANAVANALGVRMKELPMTPDRVLDALEEV